MSTKSNYKKWVWEYERRRENLRSSYAKSRRHLTYKISSWKRQIRRIEEREKKIKHIYLYVNSFFDIDIKNINQGEVYNLAINVFYKYGMESGIQGSFLARFLNRKALYRAAVKRRMFTQSFKTSQANKETYHNFINYINNASENKLKKAS